MLDPNGIPILLRVLDFLFDEGSKILQERRERRKNEIKTTNETNHQTNISTLEKHILSPKIISKDQAKKELVNEALWLSWQDEVEHQIKLLEIHKKNYYLAKEQYSLFGRALVPQIIIHNMNDAEERIQECMEKLKNILGEVYEKKITLPNEN